MALFQAHFGAGFQTGDSSTDREYSVPNLHLCGCKQLAAAIGNPGSLLQSNGLHRNIGGPVHGFYHSRSVEIKCTLWFYFFCGIGFLIVAIAIEETANGRGRIRYTILHFLYVGVYIYFVFIRTILDVSFIRRIYVLMTSTYGIAYSLATDAYLFCVALQMYRSVHRKRRPIILAMTQPNVPSNPAVHQEELECLPVSGGNRATILTV